MSLKELNDYTETIKSKLSIKYKESLRLLEDSKNKILEEAKEKFNQEAEKPRRMVKQL